jgi:DNA repair ATPase RecN
MKITKLGISNFLSVRRFEADKLGRFNYIKGDTWVGKSAVLKAITAALVAEGVQPQFITKGEDKCEIVLELDERILIRRSMTAKGTYLNVRDGDKPISSPQAWLDGVLGKLALNPVDFFKADAKKRMDMLLEALPIEFDDSIIDQCMPNDPDAISEVLEEMAEINSTDRHGLLVLADYQQVVYDKRKLKNAEADRLAKSAAVAAQAAQELDLGRWQGFDLPERLKALSEAQKAIGSHDGLGNEINRMHDKIKAYKLSIVELERQIAGLQKETGELENQVRALEAEYQAFEEPDLWAIQDEIKAFNLAQGQLAQAEQAKIQAKQAEEAKRVAGALDTFYRHLKTDAPKALLAKAHLPVDGLELTSDGVLIDGISLETLSTSEQMILALKIAKALAGELKVICIDRFESIGKGAALEAFLEATKDDGMEYFITQVTEGPLTLETQE